MPLTNYTFQQLIDFTRTSSGTFVGSNGLIQTTPQSRNLLTFTQEFDNAGWTKNNATITANSTVAPDGTSTADKLNETATTGFHNAGQAGTVASSTVYTVSVYAKAAERGWLALDPVNPSVANHITYFDLVNGVVGTNAAGNTAAITSVGNGWYRCSVTRTTTGSQTSIRMEATTATANNTASYAGVAGSGIFLWGAQLEQASTASDYTRNVGGLFPPRFDYDPVTLAPRGILIEEQRVNLLVRSEQFDNAAWGLVQATVSANTAISPDGASNADKLVENTASSVQHFIYASTSKAASSITYSATVFCKAAERSRIRIWLHDSAGNGPDADANLSAGTIGAAVNRGAGWTSVSSSITNVGNGWYRCTVIGTSNSATSLELRLTLLDNSGSVSYTGDGTSGLFLYGAQLEAGAFATSYIPTVASQVTRTADQASIVAPMFAPWYNESAGTLVFEGTSLTTSGFTWPAIASSGSAANAFGTYRSAAFVAGFIASSSVTQMEITSSPVVANVPYKLGIAAQANNGNFSFNGNIGTADTAITMPVVNRLSLGVNSAGNAEFLNGHIRRVTYYPTRLSDLQLQALTA